MGKKSFHRYFLGAILIAAAMMPSSQNVNATPNETLLGAYQAYPAPISKPLYCPPTTEVKYETNFNEKQAAAAALGLYLGAVLATAPQKTTQSGVNKNLCV